MLLYLLRMSVALWCVSSLACGAYRPRTTPPARVADTIRVVSWNVLNLFDHVDDPFLSGQWDDAPLATSHGRCESIAKVLRAIDADIVTLQEVESLACLTWFRDTFLPDMRYDYIASIDGGYHRGVECAVLSRIPLRSAHVEHAVMLTQDDADCAHRPLRGTGDPAPYARPPLRVTVDDGEGVMALFVVHHKSGGGKNNTWRREAEACHTAASIASWQAAHPQSGVVVLGDFNARASEASVRVYRESGLRDLMTHEGVATHESGRVIDFIMATPVIARRVLAGTACVVDVARPPYGWNWKTDPRPDWSPSDHFPVMVDIQRSAGDPPEAEAAASRLVSKSFTSTASLSPRPERLISTILSWLSVLAS
jgi:endonuclease/exonuclease/phosphatase family metal-dependent hydrolase